MRAIPARIFFSPFSSFSYDESVKMESCHWMATMQKAQGRADRQRVTLYFHAGGVKGL
jgi:hypothetical protein